MAKKTKNKEPPINFNEKEKKYTILGVIVLITLLFIFAIVGIIGSKFETNSNTKQVKEVQVQVQKETVKPVEPTKPVEYSAEQSRCQSVNLIINTIPWAVGILIFLWIVGGGFFRT